MRRRALLRRVGAAGLAATAGCLGRGDPGEAPDGEETGTPGGEETGTPAVRGTDFAVTNVESSTGDQSASVSFGDAVTITGTTTGADGCYTAVLDAVEYDHPELVVTVRARRKTDAGACTDAIVDIDYRATVSVAGSGPDTVVVEHDSLGETTTVTTANRTG